MSMASQKLKYLNSLVRTIGNVNAIFVVDENRRRHLKMAGFLARSVYEKQKLAISIENLQSC